MSPRVRPSVRLSVCPSVRLMHRVFFAYKSCMDHQILMIFAQMMGIGEKLKLTLGQGHKVGCFNFGQSRIGSLHICSD